MPNVENHVRFCVKAFGERNRELCYMVNSWMDAPSRKMGPAHRRSRHDVYFTPFDACRIYGDRNEERLKETQKNVLIASIVLQHLKLDGLVTPDQEKAWIWERAVARLKERIQMDELARRREKNLTVGVVVGGLLGFTIGYLGSITFFSWTGAAIIGFIATLPGSFTGAVIALASSKKKEERDVGDHPT